MFVVVGTAKKQTRTKVLEPGARVRPSSGKWGKGSKRERSERAIMLNKLLRSLGEERENIPVVHLVVSHNVFESGL